MYGVGARGFISFKKLNQLSECLDVNVRHKLMLNAHINSVVIWVLRRIEIPMITLDEFIDLMKVIQIKMVAFYVEMPFNTFGKELHFVGIGLGDFVCVGQSWIIALTLWLKEVLGFAPRLIEIGLWTN